MKSFYIEPFKDHSNCTGHANYMLDCTYEDKEDRDLLSNVLDYYIKDYEEKSITKEV